ncbi:3288_t:CDS:1, partial [Racocetra fulgida]
SDDDIITELNFNEKDRAKFGYIKLKEEYEKAEKNIHNKNKLIIINYSVAFFVIIFGILLYLLIKNNLLGKVGSVILSSIASIIGSVTPIVSVSKEFVKKPKKDDLENLDISKIDISKDL